MNFYYMSLPAAEIYLATVKKKLKKFRDSEIQKFRDSEIQRFKGLRRERRVCQWTALIQFGTSLFSLGRPEGAIFLRRRF
jgi:hypothetical protein